MILGYVEMLFLEVYSFTGQNMDLYQGIVTKFQVVTLKKGKLCFISAEMKRYLVKRKWVNF